MASLFKRPGKPHWFLRYKEKGEWKKRVTKFRHDDPNDTSKARAFRAQCEADEFKDESVKKIGWDWVIGYIEGMELAARSRERYLGGWHWLGMWLEERKLDVPQIRYTHVHDYIDWRVGRKKPYGKSAGKNTAIMEVKWLASLLNEAVRRDFITASPLASLKLRAAAAPKKRPFTDEEIRICRAALAPKPEGESEPEWMRVAFEIGLATGCRLRETRIPMEKIDLDSDPPAMTFPNPKGGEDKAFTIPIPSMLLPLFRDLKKKRRKYTIDSFPFQPSRWWTHFFKRVEIEGVCFHCLRVTKVTRLRRDGVPREAAMRLVNHSSELIHMLYDRHQVRDLMQYCDSGIAGYSGAT